MGNSDIEKLYCLQWRSAAAMPDDQQNEQPQESPRVRGIEALKANIMEHKVDTALWATRALTLIFCILYLIPVFGYVSGFCFLRLPVFSSGSGMTLW